MKHDSSDFNFFFPNELEEFDPYFDEEPMGDVINDPSEIQKAPKAPVVYSNPDIPAPERIEKLMDAMNATARTLRLLIAFCEEPKAVDEVNDFVEKTQGDNCSVYSAATLCRLLDEAGAIERIDEEGNLANEIVDEPTVVVVDGVEYLEPAPARPSFWRSTACGLAYVAAADPEAALQALLNENPDYLPIFKRVLELCARTDGAASPALSEAVDKDPIVQEPRRYSGFFIDRLEACDAVEWKNGAWRITELGTTVLA